MRILIATISGLLSGCATVSAVPQQLPQLGAPVGLNFPQTADPAHQPALVVNRAADFPCLSCLAWISGGGGNSGSTAAILDLHAISAPTDQAFTRALVARIESECSSCQPAAIQVQARGLSPATSVFGANFEAYSEGRASVAEFNIGAREGGYVLDVVPVRLPDGGSSRIDSVLKVEGFSGDPKAAQISNVLDVRINPQQAVIVLPADQGPITVLETADGRMKEVWEKDAQGKWDRKIIIDGIEQKGM